MAASTSMTYGSLSLGMSRLSLSSHSSSYLRGGSSGFLKMPATSPVVSVPLTIEAAHKKGSGSTKNGRDSNSKRLGVKIYGDQAAKAGSIIVRQRGTKFHPGNNVGLGKDYTIFSLIEGVVKFEKFGPEKKQRISVYPKVEQPENPNSYRVRRRNMFRLKRAQAKAYKEGREVPTSLPELVLASAEDSEGSEETSLC